MIFMTYDCCKAHSIKIFGCISVYVCTAGVLLGHYFWEEIADGSAVSGVFAVVGELSVDIRRPQPRGRRTLYFAQCLSLKAEIFTDNFEIFKNCVPVVG